MERVKLMGNPIKTFSIRDESAQVVELIRTVDELVEWRNAVELQLQCLSSDVEYKEPKP